MGFGACKKMLFISDVFLIQRQAHLKASALTEPAIKQNISQMSIDDRFG